MTTTPDSPDFRALTHELNALLVYLVSTHPNLHETVIRAYLYCSDRATAALATPEPEPPTDEEIQEWADSCSEAPLEEMDHRYHVWQRRFEAEEFNETIRAALERWGK